MLHLGTGAGLSLGGILLLSTAHDGSPSVRVVHVETDRVVVGICEKTLSGNVE